MPHPVSAPDTLDAYRTTGSSPGASVTVHLLGPGAVGRAFLARLADEPRLRLVAATDRGATVHDPAGLDPLAIGAWKVERGTLAGHGRARGWDAAGALRAVRADVVVDATSTDLERRGWVELLDETVLGRGAGLALAAKDGPARAAHRWLTSEAAVADPHDAVADLEAGSAGPAPAVGIDAVLGGAGEALRTDLPRLRAACGAVALAGSASTTVIVEALEQGGTFADGVARARALDLLETDPELDFQGRDAAVKLAVVARALWGRALQPGDVPCQDVRALDPGALRARRRRGATTRLVARLDRDGAPRVAYEALPAGHPLAVPRTRVAYRYELEGGAARLHVGTGLGAAATAGALLADVRRLAARTLRHRGRVDDARTVEAAPAPCPGARLDVGPGTRVAHLPADVTLDRGGRPGAGVVAFEAVGPDDAPVVVVQGGISSDRFPAAAPGRPGWWSDQVGPGRAVDTDVHRVVSIDWLGGNGDSWGPRSASDWVAATQVTTADQARAVEAVLDTLGVARAAAYLGASYGGMVGLRLAAAAPGRVARLCVLGAAHESHPMATAVRSIQRRTVRLGRDTGRAEDGVAVARALGMTTYRSALEFAGRFGLDPEPGAPARFPVDDYLDARSRAFGRTFHPDAYLCLSESMDLHRVDPADVTVPLCAVAFDTDTLVPPWTVRALALGSSGRSRYRVVPTPYGHDGFLKETAAVAEILGEEVRAGVAEVTPVRARPAVPEGVS